MSLYDHNGLRCEATLIRTTKGEFGTLSGRVPPGASCSSRSVSLTRSWLLSLLK